MNYRIISLALLAALLSPAATLIQASGPNDLETTLQVLSNNLAVRFNLPSDFQNVSLSASLLTFSQFGGTDWNLNAFLTTQTGAGTTAALHEIASVSQTISIPGSALFPPYTITDYTVFSGLNLVAGDYYLILSGSPNTNSAFWVSSPTASATTVTNLGASVTGGYLFAGAPESYLPASIFAELTLNTSNLWFTVTGDPVVTGVPEPSTLALAAVGVLILWRRRN